MKIAVISSTVFPCPPAGYSGLEMIAWLCAKGLAEKGHEVSLVAPDGSHCPNVVVIPTGPPGGHSEEMAYQKLWPELLKQDCVIDHSWQKYSYLLKAEGRLKAPVLGVCHAPVNTMYASWPPQFHGLPPVEKGCPVCISQDQATHFEALFGRPARVARNGIDLDYYRPLEYPRSKRFLFLARFSSIKGPDLAIEACRKAGVGLDLVGDTSITNEPEYLEKCKRMCHDHNESLPFGKGGAVPAWKHEWDAVQDRRIHFIGPANRGECVWWFSQAHCMLHPNQRFREPLGLAPLESQACGTPVIAWDYGAMRETIKNGETGLLVRSMDELVVGVNSFAGGIGDGMRKRCREWASQFSVENMVSRYEQLCVEAVDSGGW